MTIVKDVHVYLLLHQFLYNLTNPTGRSVLVFTNTFGRNLISVLGLTNPLGCNLISVIGFINPLSCRLISALVFTSHLKSKTIFLILLCLAVPFLQPQAVFVQHIIYFCNQSTTTERFIIQVCRNTHKDGPHNELEAYTEKPHSQEAVIIIINTAIPFYPFLNFVILYFKPGTLATNQNAPGFLKSL